MINTKILNKQAKTRAAKAQSNSFLIRQEYELNDEKRESLRLQNMLGQFIDFSKDEYMKLASKIEQSTTFTHAIDNYELELAEYYNAEAMQLSVKSEKLFTNDNNSIVIDVTVSSAEGSRHLYFYTTRTLLCAYIDIFSLEEYCTDRLAQMYAQMSAENNYVNLDDELLYA